MDDRQWATFVSQAGIQADRAVKTFTPVWSGFSVDPVGDLNYFDFGTIVFVWTNDDLSGTSDQAYMTLTGVPESIQPTGDRVVGGVYFTDNGTFREGIAQVLAIGGQIVFSLNTVEDDGTGQLYVQPSSTGFHNTGTKGLSVGTMLVYQK